MELPTTAIQIPIAVYAYQRHKQPTDPHAVKRIGFYDKRKVKEETKFQNYYVRAKAVPSRAAFKEYQQSLVDATKMEIKTIRSQAKERIDKKLTKDAKDKIKKETEKKVEKVQKIATMRDWEGLDRRYIHDIKYEKNVQLGSDAIYVYIPVKYYKINTSKFDPIAGNMDGLLAFGQSKWNLYNGKKKDVDFIYDNEIREETQKELFEYLLKVKIIDVNRDDKLNEEEVELNAKTAVAEILRRDQNLLIPKWGGCGYPSIHRVVWYSACPLLISFFTYFNNASGLMSIAGIAGTVWNMMKTIINQEPASGISDYTINPLKEYLQQFFKPEETKTISGFGGITEFLKPLVTKITEAVLSMLNAFVNNEWVQSAATSANTTIQQVGTILANIGNFNYSYRLLFNLATFGSLCFMDGWVGQKYNEFVCLLSKLVSNLYDLKQGKISTSILYARNQADLLRHIKLDLYPQTADIINMLKKEEDDGGKDLRFFGFKEDISPRLVLNNNVTSVLVYTTNQQKKMNVKPTISLNEGPIFVYVIASMKKDGKKYWYYYDYNYKEDDPASDFFKIYEVAAFANDKAVLSGPIPKPGVGKDYCQRKIGNVVISGVPYKYYLLGSTLAYYVIAPFVTPFILQQTGILPADVDFIDLNDVYKDFLESPNTKNSIKSFVKSSLYYFNLATNLRIGYDVSILVSNLIKYIIDMSPVNVNVTAPKGFALTILKLYETSGVTKIIEYFAYLIDFMPCIIAVFFYNLVNKNKQNYL